MSKLAAPLTKKQKNKTKKKTKQSQRLFGEPIKYVEGHLFAKIQYFIQVKKSVQKPEGYAHLAMPSLLTMPKKVPPNMGPHFLSIHYFIQV